MSCSKQSISEGKDNQAADCVICLGAPKFPTGRPDACTHVFCFLCISDWVKRRSECPLCKRKAKFIIKTLSNGNVTKIKVKERTAAHFSNELASAEERAGHQREVDITVAYASCRVCHGSDNEDRLLLCDGTVGQNLDGSPIRCNAAYHCYCLPEPLADIPRGRWYCPFCADLRETQRGVYNRRYATRRSPALVTEVINLDADEPGPSRRRPLRRRIVVIEGDGDSFSEEMSSSDESDDLTESSVVISDDSDDVEPHQITSDEEPGEDALGDEENWDVIDDYVLNEVEPDHVSEGPRTTVRRRAARKKVKKRKATKKKKVPKTKKRKTKEKDSAGTRKKRRKTVKKKSVTRGQRKLASAIGIDPETGDIEKKVRKDRYPADGIRRGKFGAPVLSLLSDEFDDIPVPESDNDSCQTSLSAAEQNRENNVDLIGPIMFEQTKTLAPARYQRVGRDGKILETELMVEHRKQVDRKIAQNQAFAEANVMNVSNIASKSEGQSGRSTHRKNRPSRWGSPTPSSENISAANTASIPLPVGPPLPQKALDLVPVPQPNVIRPPISSQMSFNNRPSALNTSPSTSFALNAFASPLPPFGMNPSGLSTQSGVPQLGNMSVSQLPLPSQLFPGILMPPPLTLGSVNDLLAAGFIGNSALTAPPISQASPFVLGPVPNQNQGLAQHLVNLASTLHPLGTHSQKLSVSGVPPPPPAVSTCKPEVELSISKPLAEKIRQIAEGNELRPLAENNEDHERKIEEKETDERKHNESGRKSASAEEEEGNDPDTKVTTSKGPMFNQARQMLSTSLKKMFKKRLITKDEYKMIMKKGVTALSQRTKLDQAKVDDYANKYVQCVIHRRKKSH